MLSVYSTLKETVLLWLRNFWSFTVISLVLGSLEIGAEPLLDEVAKLHVLLGIGAAIGMIAFHLFLSAVRAAAILGLLKGQRTQEPGWISLYEGVKNNTWTLMQMMVLIALLAVPLILLFFLLNLMLSDSFGIAGGGIAVLIGVTLYLALLKYALADPLIVLEDRDAWDALEQSWVMTRGFLWYVIGCYLVLGLLQLGVTLGIGSFSATFKGPGTWLLELTPSIFAPLWIVMGWCMYFDIRKTRRSDFPVGTLYY